MPLEQVHCGCIHTREQQATTTTLPQTLEEACTFAFKKTTDDEFYMVVNRDNIFLDTMEAAKRIVFSPLKKIQVNFVEIML